MSRPDDKSPFPEDPAFDAGLATLYHAHKDKFGEDPEDGDHADGDEEPAIDASFEVNFTVPVLVRNINDAVINQAAVVQAAKDGARQELIRQLNQSMSDGDFDIAEE